MLFLLFTASVRSRSLDQPQVPGVFLIGIANNGLLRIANATTGRARKAAWAKLSFTLFSLEGLPNNINIHTSLFHVWIKRSQSVQSLCVKIF